MERNNQISCLIEDDKKFIWHPFTQMKNKRQPIAIIKAKGAYLYDDKGQKYLDGISSWWVNLHGHAHPYIVKRIKTQAKELDHVLFADFTHKPAVELAKRLITLFPKPMSKVFYSDNGSTAVETALKMAIQYWFNKDPLTQKRKVICFKNSYHGDTFGAMSAAGKNEFNRPFWRHFFETVTIDPPIIGKEETTCDQLQAILQKGECACFIFEPLILGSGGMIIYEARALDKLLALCKKNQVLTIADEVMTGFGRCGSLFASQFLKESPDLVCLSKGLTGGFLALGATLCQEHIYNAFLSDKLCDAFLHGHSYTGNPIACCASLASLDLLTREDAAQKRLYIARSHVEFCLKVKNHPKLNRVESLGTILVLEYKTEKSSYFQSIRDKLYAFFLNKGLLLRPLGNVLYVMPPYCITRQELNTIYKHILLTLKDSFI